MIANKPFEFARSALRRPLKGGVETVGKLKIQAC